jgi:AcrR family transcriptional regulator
MNTKIKKSNNRETILRATSQLISKSGLEHLTLDAVAQEAGVSKGGLLYHFPSKEALVEGLLKYFCDDFNNQLEQQLTQENESEKNAPGYWLRAYIRASIQPGPSPDLSTALMAAIAVNPQLLEPLREDYARWQHQTENDGLDPALATLIRLALDGLWVADFFNLAPPSGELREQLVAKLLELSRGKEQ